MKNRLKAFGIQEISIIQKFSLSLGDYTINPTPPKIFVSKLCLHVQCSLGLGRLLFGAVSDEGGALGQVQMECQQWAMLHADRPQG